jgi:uncharacterized membrane protein/membrane-bound inhibitor of C-type lysozyme
VQRSRSLLPLLAALAAVACGGPPEPPAPPVVTMDPDAPPPATVVDASTRRELHFLRAGRAYRCGVDASFVVRERGDSVEIHLPGRTALLPPVPAASGARWATDAVSFWSRGEEALLELEGTVLSGCRSDVESAPWAEARARGVQFRAVGQEPGWHLEISEGGRTVYVGNYGETSWSGPTARPRVSAAGDTIRWALEERGEALEVIATDTPCFDVMSGEPYESTVTVRMEDQEFRGCGRFLR